MYRSARTIGTAPGSGEDCVAHATKFQTDSPQINDLRLAIPRIIEPFHRPPNSTTWKLYSQGLEAASKGLGTFKEQWNQPEMQNILEHVDASFKGNPDLSESVSVSPHGWVERERKAKESTKSKGSESVEDSGVSLTDEDISRIVVEFRKSHPNLKLETKDDNSSISVRPSSALQIRFAHLYDRRASFLAR